MKTPNTSKILANVLRTPLLRNLLVTSLAVALVFPVYSAFFVFPAINDQIAAATEDEAVRVADYLASFLISRNTVLKAETLSGDMPEKIMRLQKDLRLEKIKIFSEKGKIIFSTDRRDIGETNTREYFDEIVAHNHVFSEIILKNTKSMEGRIVKADVVETYVPILSGGKFAGAFEIYYDITERKQRLNGLVRHIYFVFFGIAATFLATIIALLLKASSDTIERDAAKEALQNAYDSLDAQVKERTAALTEANEKLQAEVEERTAAERAFRQSEEQYRKLIETSTDAIISVDEDMQIVQWNRAASEVFGYRQDEVVGHKMSFLVPAKHMNDHLKGFRRFLQTGVAKILGKTATLEARKKDGSAVPVELSISAFQKEGAWVFTSIIRDITERKKAEEEKRKIEFQLRQAQKMESIGTLAGGIAHDFNNILASIIGYTELAMDDVAEGTAVDKNLQEVYAAGKRAKELVKQILVFARQSEEEVKPVQVSAVAREVLRFIRSSVPATVEIRQSIESDSMVMGNATQIHQILMNLCTNAAQAMEGRGGVLSVRLRDVAEETGRGRIPEGLRRGSYAKVTVSDTGMGMSPEIVASIFDPYFTTKGPGKGTGMGLSVVHGIVESCGGKITVDSTPGKGSVFTVYLPITGNRGAHRSCPPEERFSGSERILFVDDEAPITNMGARILERFGYSVTTRTSSVEALELFRSKPDAFDLVITDMTMPNMTGDLLAAEMTAIRQDIPVILCSGYSRLISEKNASALGIRAFAYKPLVRAELGRIVRDVLDGVLSAG